MHFIKNFDNLAKTNQRKIVLSLIETAFSAIKPSNVLQKEFTTKNSLLDIKGEKLDLKSFNRIFLLGFGKGSAGIAKVISKSLGSYLTAGFVIDNVPETFAKIHFTLGTHPLPSADNLAFTKTVLENIKNLTSKDLVLVVICGGGSALFEYPYAASLEKLNKINHDLINSGATIKEINVIRKHLSNVKGGGLAKHFYPAKVRSLIFSDVPGNDISVIASGPTAQDSSTLKDVEVVLQKYNLNIPKNLFHETQKDAKYFQNVKNIIMLSNLTALIAMHSHAESLGFKPRIYSDKIQGDAKTLGQKLVNEVKPHEILLVGGETTIHVTGKGHGGRNQTLVTASLPYLGEDITFASFDSDGVDFYEFAGGIGDYLTLQKAQEEKLDPSTYLSDDNTYEFLHQVGDGIKTGKLESNVSDLMVILRK